MSFVIANISTKCLVLPFLTSIALDCFLSDSNQPTCTLCSHLPLCLMSVMMVAGLYNFMTSLCKLMASQQVLGATSRICIIGIPGSPMMCFRLEQQQNETQLIRQLINYYTNSASIHYKEMLDYNKIQKNYVNLY